MLNCISEGQNTKWKYQYYEHLHHSSTLCMPITIFTAQLSVPFHSTWCHVLMWLCLYDVNYPGFRLAFSKRSNRLGVSLPSPEDGNESSFRNVVGYFVVTQNSWRWSKSRNPVILSELSNFGVMLLMSFCIIMAIAGSIHDEVNF
jgi:hypothetical protein